MSLTIGNDNPNTDFGPIPGDYSSYGYVYDDATNLTWAQWGDTVSEYGDWYWPDEQAQQYFPASEWRVATASEFNSLLSNFDLTTYEGMSEVYDYFYAWESSELAVGFGTTDTYEDGDSAFFMNLDPDQDYYTHDAYYVISSTRGLDSGLPITTWGTALVKSGNVSGYDVPELDGTAGSVALALAIGLFLILKEKRLFR